MTTVEATTQQDAEGKRQYRHYKSTKLAGLTDEQKAERKRQQMIVWRQKNAAYDLKYHQQYYKNNRTKLLKKRRERESKKTEEEQKSNDQSLAGDQ